MKYHTIQNPMVTGWRLRLAVVFLKLHIFLIALFHIRSWKKTMDTVKKLKQQIRYYRGPHSIQKVAFVGGRYYWDLYGEGWPSLAFNRNVVRECNRILSDSHAHVGMRNVLFGITTKCPMQCEHCYEWHNLNLKERLTFSDCQRIIEKLLTYGAGQIHLGGGEPMMRFDEIVQLLKLYSNQAGFWIVTSGYNVTAERAQQLKAAGLTGMCVSVDHVNEEEHNAFRHHKNAFSLAQEALKVSSQAGLVTALSLCATKEFTSEENLYAYARMGKNLGVSFIQVLEPRAAGHFEGKSVHLSEEQKQLLTNYFLSVNNDSAFVDYPNIIYHEYYRDTLGCRGAGISALYIDPMGEVHACPFCRHSVGNILTETAEECIDRLRQKGCAVPSIKSTLPVIKSREVLV